MLFFVINLLVLRAHQPFAAHLWVGILTDASTIIVCEYDSALGCFCLEVHIGNQYMVSYWTYVFCLYYVIIIYVFHQYYCSTNLRGRQVFLVMKHDLFCYF